MDVSRPSRQNSRFGTNKNNSLSEEIIKEYKNIIQDRNRRHIVLLCTDLTNKAKSKHIVDSALAFIYQGHKVTVITSAFSNKLYLEDLSNADVIVAGKWIPTNFLKYMGHIFYFFRSFYITVYGIYICHYLQPKISVVFCETSYFMIPLLKWFTNYKLVYFQYEFDLAKFRLPAKDIYKKNWLLGKCLQMVDQVLVPNEMFYNIYNRSYKHTNINLCVCQPYLNVRKLRKEKLIPLSHTLENVNKKTVVFLVLGEYHPRSNIELALDAFHLLLHTTDHAEHSRLMLVIGGHAGRHQASYVRHLNARAKRLQLGSRVILQPRPSRRNKKSFLAGCAALLSCQEFGLWDRYILEAMALGRPVIAVNNGFSNEVLEHGVSGYVVPATPDHFCAAMSEIVFNVDRGEFVGKMAQCEFLRKFSLESYGDRLDSIITNLFIKEHENQNVLILNNNELFFG